MTNEQPIYAVGDVHGNLDKLRFVHGFIARDGGEDAQIIHLGDLIDKGPDSRGVITYLMEGQARGRPWLVVKGNHDNKLPRFLDDPLWVDHGAQTPNTWLGDKGSGAADTLQSYGVRDPLTRPLDEVHRDALAAIPREHAQWLDRLPLTILDPRGWLFVHAGIRPGVDLGAQDSLDLMNIRGAFRNSTHDHGVLVLHGHTPIRHVTHYGNRVNLDTGASTGGPVSAVRIDAQGVWLLGEDAPVLLQPETTPC